MRHFEKTGEKLKRLTVSGGKKALLFPSYCLSLSFKFKEPPGCRKKKGRIDRWQERRERKLSSPVFSMNTYISPKIKYHKMCPKIKALDPFTEQGKRKSFFFFLSHSKISIHKISIYQIKRSKKNETAVALSDCFTFLLFLDLYYNEG